MMILLYIIIGLGAGTMSGFFGVGGATILIPAFVFFFGMTQHQAQGTALAVLLPPVFLLAVMKYYQAGHVHVRMAVFIAVAFTAGAFLGAQLVQGVPDTLLRRIFGILLVVIGLRMVF